MSEPNPIPDWGNKLAQRIAVLEDQWHAFQHPPSSPSTADPFTSAAIAAGAGGAAPADHPELERRQQALATLEHETQSARTRLTDALKQAEAAEGRATQSERLAADHAARFAEQQATLQAEAARLDRTRRVVDRIWPRFMLTSAFAEWKTGVETTILSDAPSSSAALLFANLHGYTACLLENDQKYLRDGLRDISRFLYAWLKDTGHTERAAFDIALAWAAAFNEECTGKCEIEVPEPGTPANALSMTFPPRGSSPEVVSVRTWCVRDAQRRVIHRAEVFT